MKHSNRNKGIRVSIIDNPQSDVHIISCSVEKNHKNSPEVDKSTDPYFTLRFVVAGKGYAIINKKKYILEENSILVSFPFSDIQLCQDANDPYTLAWFVFDGTQAKYWLSRVNLTAASPLRKVTPSARILSAFTKTPTRCFKNPTFSDSVALSAFYDIITEIQRQDATAPSIVNTTKKHYIQEAVKYINEHYQDPSLNLKTISSALGVSYQYLSTLFKSTLNVSVTTYIITKRLSAATTLLEQGNKTIANIAEEVGFTSPYYFSTVYKKFNKATPMEHKKYVAPPPKK